MRKSITILMLLVGALLTACTSSPRTPEEFLKAFYFASADNPDKAISMLDSGTLPPNDGMAKSFITDIAKGTQAQYRSHGGIESVEDIKTWTAKRDPKYTGYSLTLHFKDGKTSKPSGYLIKENGQWRMTTAANQG